MARVIFTIGCYFIGIAAVLIGTAIALIGIEPTGQVFVALISILRDSGPLTDLGQPNDDSELRFYSVFFIAYGVVLVRAARDPVRHARIIPVLLGLFFLGGVARGLSLISVGPPHDLFFLLMIIELVMPPVLYLCWRRMTFNTES